MLPLAIQGVNHSSTDRWHSSTQKLLAIFEHGLSVRLQAIRPQDLVNPKHYISRRSEFVDCTESNRQGALKEIQKKKFILKAVGEVALNIRKIYSNLKMPFKNFGFRPSNLSSVYYTPVVSLSQISSLNELFLLLFFSNIIISFTLSAGLPASQGD